MSVVAAYSFDASNANDDSGNGHNGTLNGAPTFPAGHTNLGMLCSPTGPKWASVPDHAAFHFTNAWTVMGWVKPTSLVVGEIISKPNQWWFSMDGSGTLITGFYFSGGGSTTGISVPSVFSAGTFAHVAARFNGTDLQLVVNGVQQATNATWAGQTMATSANAVGLGSWDGVTENIDALLDDLRIFNTYENDAAIASWMSTPAGPGGGGGSVPSMSLLGVGS